MSTPSPAERLREVICALDSNHYFNGGQTVVPRYPLGSEARAHLIAEAVFWQHQIEYAERIVITPYEEQLAQQLVNKAES